MTEQMALEVANQIDVNALTKGSGGVTLRCKSSQAWFSATDRIRSVSCFRPRTKKPVFLIGENGQ